MAAKFYAVLDTNVLVSGMFTGNTKHFPKEPIVVTPAQMLEIIHNAQKGEE